MSGSTQRRYLASDGQHWQQCDVHGATERTDVAVFSLESVLGLEEVISDHHASSLVSVLFACSRRPTVRASDLKRLLLRGGSEVRVQRDVAQPAWAGLLRRHNKLGLTDCRSQVEDMLVSSSKKSVLITGCTPGGIGHALALEFHKQGFRVFATARRVETLKDLRDHGTDIIAVDVADDASVKAAAESVAELTNGQLDVLINNAGQDFSMAATDLDISRAQSLFNTNLFGVMRMVREFAPLLVKAKGKIFNIGSVAGVMPVPFRSVYGASKAALHSYGDSLRLEMKPFDVTVITLVTGSVFSKMSTGPPPCEGIDSPESLYWPAADAISNMYSNQSEGAMPAGEYAKRVVGLAQGSRNAPWVWEGHYAPTLWFMATFVSKKAFEGITGRLIKGIGEMDALIRAGAAPH